MRLFDAQVEAQTEDISIHSSQAGWDYQLIQDLNDPTILFQSTHPKRDETPTQNIYTLGTKLFQSTHPKRDETHC